MGAGPRRQTQIIWADACICTAFGWMATKGLICITDYVKWVLERQILKRESCRIAEHAPSLLLFPVSPCLARRLSSSPLAHRDLSAAEVAAVPFAL